MKQINNEMDSKFNNTDCNNDNNGHSLIFDGLYDDNFNNNHTRYSISLNNSEINETNKDILYKFLSFLEYF